MKRQITIGEKYSPAMEMTDQAEADKYFEECVTHCLSFGGGRTREQAEAIERSNLGYYAGYYDHETRARVERLFRCAHPIFGSIAKNGPPTMEEEAIGIIEAGIEEAIGIIEAGICPQCGRVTIECPCWNDD